MTSVARLGGRPRSVTRGVCDGGGWEREASLNHGCCYSYTHPHLTFATSTGPLGDQSRSKVCLYRFVVQRRAHTSPRVLKLPLEMLKNPKKALTSVSLGAETF